MSIVTLSTDASGAAQAAQAGQVVVIVDLIDFSTTAEAVLEAGVRAFWGAAPDSSRPPVPVNPFAQGKKAGELALQYQTQVIAVSEPRWGSSAEQAAYAAQALAGVRASGAMVENILPNCGAGIVHLADFNNKVVLGITATGGTAFDAAACAKAPAILTATIARTAGKKGRRPAQISIERAVKAARSLKTGLTIVAASANSLEDVLAAEYLFKLAVELWRQ